MVYSIDAHHCGHEATKKDLRVYLVICHPMLLISIANMVFNFSTLSSFMILISFPIYTSRDISACNTFDIIDCMNFRTTNEAHHRAMFKIVAKVSYFLRTTTQIRGEPRIYSTCY